MRKFIYLTFAILIIACSDDDSHSINDIKAPIITLLGNSTISITQYTTYIDAGATAIDNVDGDLTSSIVVTGNPNMNVIATYTITYNVSDVAGNTASASRQVAVIEDIDNPVYIDTNGITIKAKEWAEVGATGQINDITYTVVDKPMLEELIENGDDLSKLATTKVTSMALLFYGATNFNQVINNWDMSNVINTYAMFWDAFEFNQDIGNWDMSNVLNMSNMFTNATAFNQSLKNWDVSNVDSMRGLFVNASNFNQDIGNWNVGNVTNMNWMFYEATSFNQALENWDVSFVDEMYGMFSDADSYNQNLSSWNVENVTLCGSFNANTTQWILPKPTFTNCTP
jgi:surface protein